MKTTKTTGQKNSLVLLIVAALMGLLTVVLTYMHIQRIKSQVDVQMGTIYRLAKNVERGDKLRQRDLIPEPWPQKLMPSTAVQNVENEEGRIFQRSAAQGDPLTHNLFTDSSGSGSFEPKEGMQVLTIPIASSSSSRLLQAGEFINLYAAFSAKGQPTRVMPVIEKVKVVVVGTQTVENRSSSETRVNNYRSVEIMVKKEHVQPMLSIKRHVGDKGFEVTIPASTAIPKHININPIVKEIVGID